MGAILHEIVDRPGCDPSLDRGQDGIGHIIDAHRLQGLPAPDDRKHERKGREAPDERRSAIGRSAMTRPGLRTIQARSDAMSAASASALVRKKGVAASRDT